MTRAINPRAPLTKREALQRAHAKRWPWTVEERFWFKVKKTATCWLWMGRTTKPRLGYGQLDVDGRSMLAHRLSWSLHHGDGGRAPIPHGRQVLHRCDNGLCVRPDHLYLGDTAANMIDRSVRERQPNRKLTAAIVVDMRTRRRGGERVESIAALYRVSRATAGDAISGRTWSHVR